VKREKIISTAIIVVGEVVLLSDAEDRLAALTKQAEAIS
jgi:uroporphyrin-III C-methyltransferase